MVIPQRVRHSLAKRTFKVYEYTTVSKVSVNSVSRCFNRYKFTTNKYRYLINVHKWFGHSFQACNIRNVCRARGDGHHYDVTNKRCDVTIMTSLVERALSFQEIICVCQKLWHFWKMPISSQIKCGIKANSLECGVLPNGCTTLSTVRAKITRPSTSGFLPPPRT